jgi:hypothetical protein
MQNSRFRFRTTGRMTNLGTFICGRWWILIRTFCDKGAVGKNRDTHSKIIIKYSLFVRTENQYKCRDKFCTHLCSMTPVSTLSYPFMIADIVVIHSYLQYLFYCFNLTNLTRSLWTLQTCLHFRHKQCFFVWTASVCKRLSVHITVTSQLF